jgi:hypothetical protein
MPKVVVFLGPSLPEGRAKQILDAEYLPPAKRWDVLRSVQSGAEVICLIDGVFFHECSVAHKEILHALEEGAKVIGASSMGALRASELDIYGMEGVGEIYQAYKRGELVSDDEVALIFDPFTMEPLSEPLVNIRYNLRLAVETGVVDQSDADLLIRAAASLYFPERSYQRMIEASEGVVDEEALERFERFIEKDRVDLKMMDAIRALQRTAEVALGLV